MLVFIDDSGDPGFKIGSGSTRFFVIALVLFDDPLEAERTAVAIKELRRELGLSDQSEFKFHKSRPGIRIAFLKKIRSFNFKIRALVVDKKIIRSEELRRNKSSFYAYFIKTALKNGGPDLISASVKIDGSGDREFRRGFLTYLRRELNGPNRQVVRKCRLVDSAGNVMVQMADMIAGAIHRSKNEDKEDREEYRKIIAKHIEDEWPFQ